MKKRKRKGCIIVFEGTDGSGKKVQSERCYGRLKARGIPVMKLDYPRYEKPSSQLVKGYLAGDFGSDPAQVDPYLASSFYAIDRFASYLEEFKDFYENGGTIIFDRYVTSNMLHQAGKIKDLEEKNKLLNWLHELEYGMYGLPKPNKVFFLDVPPEMSLKLREDRLNKINGEVKKDIHESDPNHIIDAYENANHLIDMYGWERINCMDGEELKSIEDINQIVFEKILDEIWTMIKEHSKETLESMGDCD